MSFKIDTRLWTYGAEHEWGDWSYNDPLPEGFGRDVRDFTCMSSSGIANDPKGVSYAYGGEINTPPTQSMTEQAWYVTHLKKWFVDHGSPAPTINHRSNLHIHIRVPGLRDDLAALKRVQLYIHENMWKVLKVIQPMPRPTLMDNTAAMREFVRPGQPWNYEASYLGMLRRWKRRKISHQNLLTPKRLIGQLTAGTVDEFFAREVPRRGSDGAPQWHLQPRLCVNLRQLRDTDTVEFRHFAGTLEEEQLALCIEWCSDFMKAALNDLPIQDLLDLYDGCGFPEFPTYVHHLENRYRATCHDGTNKRPDIEANIQKILNGEFDEFD